MPKSNKPREITVRFTRLTAVLLFVAALCASSLAADKAPAPGAATILAGTPEQYLSACHADMDRAKSQMAALKAMKAPRDPIPALDAYDEAELGLANALFRSGLAREVEPTAEMRSASEKCEQEADALNTDFSLDRGIYVALAGLDRSKLDAETKFYLEHALRDFRRAGVDRDDATRARIKDLREQLVRTGQQFGNNIKSGVLKIAVDPAELNGLPDDFRAAHKAGPDGKSTLTTDNTDYIPFMTYSASNRAREEFWKLYRQRGHPKNLDTLAEMLQERYELATLLGYKDWADYITEDKMIGSEKNAADFIEKIATASRARMEHDYQELLERKRQDDPKATVVYPWESPYLSEKVRAEKYDFDARTVRPYFQYAKVKQGIMDLTSKMFGISYRRVPDAKVWHPDVETYDVYDGDRLLGRIYFDMFPRENKYKHYATFGMANGKRGRALPESVLVCNFPRPDGDDPGLMEHGDVVTFFHEYGHLLHAIFSGNTRWTGPNLEWDFIEAPSQMLEEWAWDPGVLQTFARHYKTGEALPLDVARRMKTADDFGRGLQVRQQMFYAALSLQLYSRNPKGLDSSEVVAQLQDRYTPFKYVKGTYMQEGFGHLDGYSAIYYTYMWSLVIAKDMLTVFKHDGLLSPEAAAHYRHAVLEPGGSKPAATLVTDFLGRPYGFKAYEDWLNGKM
jgi:thimet oligopeptidase